MLKKLAGLSDADARRSTVQSGTNLAGLIQHLTFVESRWFEEVVAGGAARRGQRSMQVDPSVSLKTLRAAYRAACEASNKIIAVKPRAGPSSQRRTVELPRPRSDDTQTCPTTANLSDSDA